MGPTGNGIPPPLSGCMGSDSQGRHSPSRACSTLNGELAICLESYIFLDERDLSSNEEIIKRSDQER